MVTAALAGVTPEVAERWMRDVHRAHAQPLMRYLLRLTLGDRQAAEDLLQDTLLRAWRHINQLPADIAEVRPWLFRVARNRAVDVARSRKARPVETATADLMRLPTPGDPMDDLLTAAAIRRALLELSPAHRMVLDELYFRDATVAEAADHIGVPAGTVKSRAHYALRALRAAIGDDWPDNRARGQRLAG